MCARSEPWSGSLKTAVGRMAPDASPGSSSRFCSSVPHVEDQLAGDLRARAQGADPQRRPRDLLGDDAHRDPALSAPSEGLRDRHPEDAQLGQSLDQLKGDQLVVAVDALGQGSDLALGEALHLGTGRLERGVGQALLRASASRHVTRDLDEHVSGSVKPREGAYLRREERRLDVRVLEPHVGEGDALAGPQVHASEERPAELAHVGTRDASLQLVAAHGPRGELPAGLDLHVQVREAVGRQLVTLDRAVSDATEGAAQQLVERCEHGLQLRRHSSPGASRVASTIPWNRNARVRS